MRTISLWQSKHGSPTFPLLKASQMCYLYFSADPGTHVSPTSVWQLRRWLLLHGGHRLEEEGRLRQLDQPWLVLLYILHKFYIKPPFWYLTTFLIEVSHHHLIMPLSCFLYTPHRNYYSTLVLPWVTFSLHISGEKFLIWFTQLISSTRWFILGILVKVLT